MIMDLAEKTGLTDTTIFHEQEYEKYIAWSLFVRARGAPRIVNAQRRRPGANRQYYVVYVGNDAVAYPTNAASVAKVVVEALLNEVRGD